jgi:hypothetical protein
MKQMQGWKRAGWMAGVAVMMVAAVSAGAQTTLEDATKAADMQAAEQTQAAVQQADVQAQMAKIQAQVARQEAQLAPQRAKLAAQVSAQVSAQTKAQIGRIQTQVALQQAQLVPLREKLQIQMLPMEAKLEVMMAPMQAEMLARGAQMQAQMLARSAVMQAEMVSVGDPQVKDELFEGTEKFAKGATDVTNVNLGPDMLGMVTGKHGGDVAHKLNFMVVRSYTYPQAGMYNVADVDAYRDKLKSGNWNCFIHTYESKSGESTDICNRALPNDEGNEMVIMTVEPKELTFIHMSGKGSLADLGKLGALGNMHMGNLNIQGPPPTLPTPPSGPNQ